MLFKPSLQTLAAVFALSCPAFSQEALILGTGGDFHSLDLKTGTTSFIGMTGHHSYYWNGLAMNSQGKIFSATGDWIAGFSIYEIEPSTGQGTFVLNSGFSEIGAMAFGPGDTLYLSHDPLWPAAGGIHELYTLDLSTGSTSFIGVTGTRNLLALDFFDDTLYGYTTSDGLVQIDTASGLAMDANENFIGYIGAAMAMCFDDRGALHYVDDALWMIDKDSGIRNPVDWIDIFGFWTEMVFVAGPNQKFSLWLDGTSGHYLGAKMTGMTPNGQAAVLWAKGEGGPTPIPPGFPCAGTMMDLNTNMQKLAIITADANGEATVGPGPRRVPAAAAGLIWLQAIDLSTCKTSNKILIYL